MNTSNSFKRAVQAVIGVLLIASADAAIVFSVSDQTPDGDNGTGTRSLSSTEGNVSAPANLSTITYTVTNLDLTSVGGGANETIAFDITFSQTGGAGVQFNGFGNVSVTGGASDNQIDASPVDDETLTATLSLNAGSTTFSGGINLSITEIRIGGFNDGLEQFDLTTDAGTVTHTSNVQSIDSSFFTVDPIDVGGFTQTDQMNIAGYTITVEAVPEPSAALLGMLGMGLLLRRCRCA